HDGATFDYGGRPEVMEAEVARMSPADVAGYRRFMRSSEVLYRLGFERFGDVPFSSWTSMARLAPDLMRLGGWRSVYSTVARFVRDERLRVALSFHPLLVGGNPFSTSAIYSLIPFLERREGVHFVMGGTGRLVQALAGLIRKQGGTIRCGAEVAEIIVEAGTATGVRLVSSERIPADLIVSNADPAWTYRYLIAPQHRRRWTDRRIERARHSMGLFVWYFGTKRRYPEVAHHTILLGPRYRELLADVFRRKVLAKDFSLYLHRPTATDSSLAPPGCDAFYVLSPVPHLGSGTDWATEAEPYRQAIAAELERTILPGLGQNIASSRVMTPQDFQNRLLSFRGAAFAMEPVLSQSAYFRPHNASEDIRGLYLVGAGTHPGAGLPGVLCSAKVLDRLVPAYA
ncbi:MAG: phytoene desaturase, partial [Acetobacteraceae bacterium]|nr:phytoene desaturase [Acetobacteraceae bacterium]